MTIWRNLIELSSMFNNDEYIVHTDRELTFEEVHEGKVEVVQGPDFSKPRLIFSRPVTPIEIERGLNTSFRGRIFGFTEERNENAPEVTQVIDELTKLINSFQFLTEYVKDEYNNLRDHIVYLIETHFYDCMSGGCSYYWLAAIRKLIEKYNIDPNTPLWVDGKTIANFLDEIKNVPRFDHLLGEIKLPKLQNTNQKV
jgi:hypothetical protein